MNNKLRLSHSSINTWKTCKELYYLTRVEKLDYKYKGSSLFFGSAIDEAVGFLLKNKQNGKDVRNEVFNHFCHDLTKGWMLTFDNPNIKYRDKDYDLNLIQGEDREDLDRWINELNVNFEYFEKKNNALTENEQILYNRICWLTLKNKAKYMLEAFCEDFYPKIKKVYTIQEKITGNIELPVYQDYATDIELTGYIDFVAELEGYDYPIIFDLKTSASFYENNSAKFSEQLLMYLAALGEQLKTNLVGYIVLLKQLKSESFCKKCGAKKDGSHRTCNQEIKGVRCKGEWSTTFKGQSQLIVSEIEQKHVETFKVGLADQAELMRLNKRVKDLDSCFKYGGPCDFLRLCHYGDNTDYTKKSY